MASIFKRPNSPFFFCAYYGADGRRLKKSTKRKNRTEAMQICMGWANAAAQARNRNLTAAQARKVLAEMVQHSTGENLTAYTLEGWIAEWDANKAGSSTHTTMLRYRQVMRDFMEHLGDRAKAPIASITPGDITKFRDHLRKGGRAVSTCNTVIKKILSVPFESARKLGYIPVNPVAGVDQLKDGGKTRISIREPFTTDEVKALVSKAKGDWKGAIILAATTGLRLGDVVALTWGSIDEGFIRIVTQKTGEAVELPVHKDFQKFLADQEQGIGKAPVFPVLSKTPVNGRAGLSRQFRGIMEAAKIKEKIAEKAGEAGRNRHSKGFHGLRHTFISTLANKGVSSEVRQKLTAHSDDAVHKFYTHLEKETFKEAVDKIPSIL
jgi:integrase